MKIDNAAKEDVMAMVELGAHMLGESDHYRDFSIDGNKIFNLLNMLIDDENGIVIVARDDAGEVVGGFVGGVAEMWFSSESKAMYDYALFIRPDKRAGRLAIRLIAEAFKQAKEKGAVEALLTNSTGVQPERVEKLYQYMEMTRVGGMYFKLL